MSGEIVEQVLELLKVVMERIVKMMVEVSIKLVWKWVELVFGVGSDGGVLVVGGVGMFVGGVDVVSIECGCENSD